MKKNVFWLFIAFIFLLSSCHPLAQTISPTPTLPMEVNKLAALLHDPDFQTRLLAADKLAQLGPAAASAIPDLILALNDTREVRETAAYALSQMGPLAAPAISELIRLLSDDGIGVRVYAVMALGNIGPDAYVATPSIITILLSDEDPGVRTFAAEALGNIGNPIAIDALINSFNDKDEFVRKYSALAIGKFGEDARFAVPTLMNLVMSEEVDISAAAAFSLSKITGENFPDSNGTGVGFQIGEDGEAIIVVAAREWWESTGKFEDWDK